MREPGFYWVNLVPGSPYWIVAEWCGEWRFTGIPAGVVDQIAGVRPDFIEIDERRLDRNQAKGDPTP